MMRSILKLVWLTLRLHTIKKYEYSRHLRQVRDLLISYSNIKTSPTIYIYGVLGYTNDICNKSKTIQLTTRNEAKKNCGARSSITEIGCCTDYKYWGRMRQNFILDNLNFSNDIWDTSQTKQKSIELNNCKLLIKQRNVWNVANYGIVWNIRTKI